MPEKMEQNLRLEVLKRGLHDQKKDAYVYDHFSARATNDTYEYQDQRSSTTVDVSASPPPAKTPVKLRLKVTKGDDKK